MFKNTKTNLIVRGILFITLGILCLFNSERITETIGTVIGLAIIIAGIVFFILGLKGYNTAFDTLRLSLSLLLIPVGLLFMLKPSLIIVILSIFVLFEGLDFTLSALKYKKAGSNGWWLMLIMGITVVALSCISIFWPDIAESVIGILVGCALIAIGCASFAALTGLNMVEEYFKATQKNTEDTDTEYVDAEVVK